MSSSLIGALRQPFGEIPLRARGECCDLLEEIEERFKRKRLQPVWNVKVSAVRDFVIMPLRRALMMGSMDELHRASREIEIRDEGGSDYRFIYDLRARVRVIELEAIYELEHNGAPPPP